MPIIKQTELKDYTIIKNYHFRDKRLSLKAKGLLSLMFSLPDDWDFSILGLTTLSSDGETSVRSTLKELENYKYLRREKVREKGIIIDWNYYIYEKPYDEDERDTPIEENTLVVKQSQYITNILNTKELSNIKEINKEKSIILKDETYYTVTEDDIKQYSILYPDVNIEQEVRNMIGWCISNPSKRKTRQGVKRFINSWLSRKQEAISKDKPPRYVEEETTW